jgi:signal transduction histidine kinase
MIRLFLHLFTPVFIVTTLFLLNVNFVFEPLIDFLLGQKGAWYEVEGIFYILDESMKNAGSAEPEIRKNKLKQLQDQFLFDLDLLDIKNIQLSDSKKQRLKQGEFVLAPDKTDVLYHLSCIPQNVWMLNFEQGKSESDNEFIKRLAKAPLEIIITNLLIQPENEWEQALITMSQKFKIPLSLFTLETIDIGQQDLKNLKHQGTIVFNENTLDGIYTQIQDTSYVLKIGPFDDPWILRYLGQFFFTVLGLLMAFIVWLLLRPVWRDLRKLQTASSNFGDGELETRVSFSNHSPIKNILQSFNGMATHIQQLISSHKELTRAVSHELRTPVSRLRFSLEMLNSTNDSTARKRFLQEMDTDIDELDELLAELLSYARMESNREFIEYSPVILADWLKNQTIVFKRDNHNKTVQVTHTGLPSYAISCMDPKLMARALNNLFQNASRYAEQHVHIDFTCQDGEYILSVDDDGPGLPVESHDRIFEPFTRIDSSRDRKSGGYGLGLAIVHQIAEAHQGTVEVTPSKLGGTRFLLTFPGSCQLQA